jgi:alpha-ketoglutarate-dependent taurine dioxygenase
MQPQYVYTHEWRMNDLVLWDNTGTMHRARPFDPDSERLLTRFTLMAKNRFAHRLRTDLSS